MNMYQSTERVTIQLTLMLVAIFTVVSSVELNIEPKNATIYVGQDISIRCNSLHAEPLTFCRFKLPAYNNGRVLSIKTKPTPEYAYFGRGLEKGDCGITLFSVKENMNGIIECSTVIGDESEEIVAQMTLTVKEPACDPLPVISGSQWSPLFCTQVVSQVNQVCELTCDRGLELTGGRQILSTDKGWVGRNGLFQIPMCKDIADISNDIVNHINNVLGGIPANMLFVLDESGSIDPEDFAKMKSFMKSIVHSFPLSPGRSAGTITFDHGAYVEIRMDHADTCSFMQRADVISQNHGGTDILNALYLAKTEISAHSSNRLTIVFLVTDGESHTDPTAAANLIKSDGDVLFCIGIGSYKFEQVIPQASIGVDRRPLFFGIDNFEIFTRVADYLETTYFNVKKVC